MQPLASRNTSHTGHLNISAKTDFWLTYWQRHFMFDNVQDAHSIYGSLVSDIVNKHATLQTKVVKTNCLPNMNALLRKSLNVRNMLGRKYDRIPNRQTWEAYRKQGNKVITLRKQSKHKYGMDKCGGKCTHSKDFW